MLASKGRRKNRKAAAVSKQTRSTGVTRRRELEKILRPLVRKLVAEAIEDRLDYLESETAAEGPGIPAGEVWRKLRL